MQSDAAHAPTHRTPSIEPQPFTDRLSDDQLLRAILTLTDEDVADVVSIASEMPSDMPMADRLRQGLLEAFAGNTEAIEAATKEPMPR